MGSHSYLVNLNSCAGVPAAARQYMQCSDLQNLNLFRHRQHYLQNLDFTFSPVMSGDSHLESGEIINGTAGQVNITGSNNYFEQGTSDSSATSSGSGGSGSGGHGGDDMAAKAMAEAKARDGSTSSSSSDGDAAAAYAASLRRLVMIM